MEQKIKWSPSGTKLEKGIWGWNPIEDSALACFICPSLREVLRIFGNNIMILKARGGKQIETEKNELKNLGLTLTRIKDNSCVIKYDKSYKQIMKCDDLNKNNIDKIIKCMENYLIMDCTVEYLLVKIKDDELKKIIEENCKTKVKTSTFYIEFNLVKCEGVFDRDEWDNTDYNQDNA